VEVAGCGRGEDDDDDAGWDERGRTKGTAETLREDRGMAVKVEGGLV